MNATPTGTSDDITATAEQSKVDLDHVFNPPTRDEWLATALSGLPNHDSLESLATQTLDGLNIQVLYDVGVANPQQHLGQHVATAGAWDNRLCMSNIGDESTANKKLIDGLEHGNASLELSVDEKTNLATLLNGVELGISTISFRAGSHYEKTAEKFHSLLSSQSIDSKTIHCSFNADPIGAWLSGESPSELDQDALKTMASFAHKQSIDMPSATAILVDTTIHHNAGASAQQELTAAMLTATVYLEALIDKGLSIDKASQLIVFQMACDADVLMGIVKIRSLNTLWQHVLREMAGLHNAEVSATSLQASIVVETSKRYLSTLDYWNNHLRNIAACTAAALSSVKTIVVHPHDQIAQWQADADTSLGERIARNLPIILDRECGLTKITDPTAGSYAIETLTQQLVDQCWDTLSDIDSPSAWLQLLTSGQWQQSLSDTHAQRVARLENHHRIMIGVNKFQADVTEQPAQNNKTLAATTAKLKLVRDAEFFEGAAR